MENTLKLAQIYNYWQTKKYPQHLKQLIFDYVKLRMCITNPRMPDMDRVPTNTDDEPRLIRFIITTKSFRSYESAYQYMEENANSHEFVLSNNVIVKQMIDRKGPNSAMCVHYFESIDRFYNITPEQILLFKMYCYDRYMRFSGVIKQCIFPPRQNLDAIPYRSETGRRHTIGDICAFII